MVPFIKWGLEIKKLHMQLLKRFDFDSNLIFVGANTLLISEAELVGLKVASEVFADRRYEDDGQLVSRKKPMPLSLILTKQSNKH